MAINKISDESIYKIKKRSAMALPNKPSEKGFSAEQIKEFLTEFVTGNENSFKVEIDRIIDEINDFIGGIENVTLKNYVTDEIVEKLTEQNPILNLNFNNETNLLEYSKYSGNGSFDILPNGMVLVDGSLLKNKSGSSFYPQTSIDKLIDKIDDKTVREYLLSLQTKLTELQDEHDRDIASLTQSFESILGGDAPEALNTIKELAEALNNNPTQVDDILLQLTNLNTNKVDKIIGKGLSTNDFTNDLKASLEALLQRDLADVSDIPTDLKSFTDDTEHRLVTDAEKNAWNSKASAIHQHNISDILNLQKILDSKSDNTHSHTLEEIGAEAKGTASNLISQHNSNTESHSDIRELIREVRNKVDGINEAISFVNEKQLSDWIAGTYIRSDGKTTNDLFVGQHIYIQEQSERDFWVSSKPVSSINDLTPLPTDKINLEDYVLKENLANVATSGSYNDLLHTPNIYYKLSEMIEDDEHKTITKQKLELIDTNAEKLLEKLDINLGLTEANKMLVTDSNGNIVTAIAGSMSALIDSLDSSSTTMAPTANQVRILNNIKLDKQQGTENANKYLYVNSVGLIDLAAIKTKLSEFINDNNYQTLTEVQALINDIPTPDVSGQISSHNIDETAHQDIRDAIKNIDLSGYSKTDHTHDYSSLFADINHTHDYATQNDINTAISNLINGAPTTLDTLKEIADAMASNQSVVSALEQSIGNKANISDLNSYLPLTAGSTKSLTGDLYTSKNIILNNANSLSGKNSSGAAKHLIGTSNTNNVWINYDNLGATIVGGSALQPFTANHQKTNLGTATASFNNIYGKTIYQNGKQVANAEDIPDTSGFVPNTRTINGKALSSNISLGSTDVGALPDYTLTISHQSAGNPRMVKFASVNYSSAATCFKMGAMTCHDNGVSYQFLTDMLIAVTTAGEVTANIYKFAQSSIGSVDGVERYTGDVFYVNDTTNKIVDFYILCGQWSASQFTPATKVGSTTISYVTQYSGTATYYSSGDKVWANGCGSTYARMSDLNSKLTGAKVDANNPNIFIGYNSEENSNSSHQVVFKGNDQSNGICWSKFGNMTTSALAPSACTYNGFFYVSSTTNSLSGADANPFLQYHTSNSDFRILTTAYNDIWLQQIATDFRSPYVYVRRRENETWYNWEKLATSSDVPKLVTLTQAEYDALGTKDANTYYFIKEE